MTEPVCLDVSLTNQTMTLKQNGRKVREFSISSASNGPGELTGSECTPRGRHYVRAKIGANTPPQSVFVGRRATGEIYSSQLAATHPHRDWILSRIFWLCGCEQGKNRLGNVDSMRRYIYIHGTPDTEPMGTPASHGCIRMRNDDIIWLFDRLQAGTPVHIKE